MIIAPQITFHNMEPSSEIEAMVLKEASQLERYFSRITSCRVLIEGPGRQHGTYRIRIDMCVPGEELVVEHNPTLHQTLQAAEATKKTKASEPNRQRRDVRLAIHEAFHEVRRRLQDYVRRMRGQTKQHEGLSSGTVVRIFPDEGYGFIEADGRELYFHRDSVLASHFDRLRIGSAVRFAEEMGEKGPQASTVRLIRPAAQSRTAATNLPVRQRRAKSS